MSLWGIGSPALLSTIPLAQVLGHPCKCFRLPLCVLSSLASLIIGLGLAHCSWFEGVSQNCHLFMGGSLSFFLFGYATCRISVLLPGIELGQMAVKARNPNHQATRELSKGPFSPSLCQEVSNTYTWYSPFHSNIFFVKFTGMLLELSTILNLVYVPPQASCPWAHGYCWCSTHKLCTSPLLFLLWLYYSSTVLEESFS